MELEQQVSDIETVEEPLRILYSRDGEDGPYTLRVDPAAFEDAIVPGLKKALKAERQSSRKLERDLRDMQRQYAEVDLEEINALQAKLQDLEKGKSKVKDSEDKWEAMRAQMNDAHQTEMATVTGERDQLRAQLHNVMKENAATMALAGETDEPVLLMPHLLAQLEVQVDRNDKPVLRVVDQEGEARVSNDGSYMTVKELVAEMKASPVYGRAFNGTGASGGGTPPGGQGGGPTANKKRGSMTVDEKSAYIAEHGKEAFLALPY